MNWDVIEPEPPTKLQRRTLYKFGIPRHVVSMLDKDQASRMIGLLIEAINSVIAATETK